MQNILDNMEFDENDKSVTVSVNTKIFPLEIVYSASAILLDDAYIVIDGNPESEVVVKLRPKENASLEELGRRFNEELITYAVYLSESRKTKDIRNALVQKAFVAHSAEPKKEEDLVIDDSEGIAKPWSEDKE